MSGKKTLVWAVVLLAVAAFYYLYEVRGDKGRREVARQKELLVRLSADDVTGITIKRATETISAVKRDGHWAITAPLAVPGDDQKFAEMVRYLADLRQLRLVEEAPTALEPFGLTSPSLEVQVQRQGHSAPLVVRLGEKNPTGSGFYAQVEGQAAVYLINTAAQTVLDASLFDLRDKTVLAFDTAAVREVELAFETAPAVQVQRQEAEHWQLTAPVRAPADAQQVQALLRSVREARVQAFVTEEAADLELYGLQTPALRLAVTVDPEPATRVLLIGKIDPERKGVYARRSDAAGVLLLPQAFWDGLPKTAAALRDKTVLRFDRDQVSRLELRDADEHLVIVRTGPRQYRLEQPVSTDGDSDAIYSLLWDLKELKARDFAAEAPEHLEPYGLASPRRRITLWEEPADKTPEARQHVLLFGNDDAEKQGTYVQVSERPTVYLVDSAEAQRVLSKTAFELRNKKLLSFEPASIQKIQLQYPASTLTLERRGETWQLSEPSAQSIEQRWKVDDLLYELSKVEYARLLAERPDDGALYGLDAPQVRLTLWQKDSTAMGPLMIGAPVDSDSAEPRLVYAQLGSTLYAIKDEILQELPKTPEDLTAEN